jgi:hypothetical protein
MQQQEAVPPRGEHASLAGGDGEGLVMREAVDSVFSLKCLLRVRFIIKTLKLIKGFLLRAN